MRLPLRSWKALLWAALLAAGVRGAAAQDAEPPTPAVQAKQVYGLLVSQGALKSGRLVWANQTYSLLEKGYQICDTYNGACFMVSDKPDAPPHILAFYEVSPGQLGVADMDFAPYWKGRSQDAVHFFMDHGARMNGVFSSVDSGGFNLFDPKGLLTNQGEAVYESLLEGRSPKWGAPGTLTPEKAPYGDPKKARAKIKTLKSRGFFEVESDEYDCLHDKFKYEDDEMSTVNVWEGPRLRIFIHDDLMGTFHSLMDIYRKKGECKPGGMSVNP